MANRMRGEVAIDVDGKAHVLRFDTNRLCDLEDIFGLSVNEVIDLLKDDKKVRIGTVRKLVWAGLGGKEAMTLQEAGDVVSALGVQGAMEKVGEAMTLAFPATDGASPTGE
jgi:Phage tail tube protein, GTA-gp10